MNDWLWGTILLIGIVWGWEKLSPYSLGRALQVTIASAAYALWLSIIPLSLYFIVRNVTSEIAQQNYMRAAFIALISLTFLPMFLIALIPWPYFRNFVRQKLPRSIQQSGNERADGGE